MSAKQPTLPGTPGPSSQAIKRAMRIETLFAGLHEGMSPLVEGLPANGQIRIQISKVVHGHLLTVTYRPAKK